MVSTFICHLELRPRFFSLIQCDPGYTSDLVIRYRCSSLLSSAQNAGSGQGRVDDRIEKRTGDCGRWDIVQSKADATTQRCFLLGCSDRTFCGSTDYVSAEGSASKNMTQSIGKDIPWQINKILFVVIFSCRVLMAH